MINRKIIAVVVPSFNEAKQIEKVIGNMPPFVDRIIIVDDCSNDGMAEVVYNIMSREQPSNLMIKNSLLEDIIPTMYNYAEIIVQNESRNEIVKYIPHEIIEIHPDMSRIVLIKHKKNGGVGAAIATGYKWCKDHEIDCTAVMAGDGQMDPSELERICTPVIQDGIDYVKGNRLIHRSAWLAIPKIRFFGNSILSILTKVASGYWHVSDTQTGYTAISLKALNSIRIYEIYKSYGMPNDLLVKLNIAFCSLKEVEIKPVYNVGEQSKMKILKVVPRVTWLLIKLFFKRLWVKYLIKDFHPLFLFYNFSFLLGIYNIKYLILILIAFAKPDIGAPEDTLIKFLFLFIASFQSLFFAMWMDISDNERLYKS